jgi:Xaa-Pro aminopeptidase
MQERNLQAYYVPSEDAHQSEYIARWDARREFISNFTGSAGFAIVTATEAALWTDGRYFLQAEKQLDSNWKLMKAGLAGTMTKEEFLGKTLSADARVGVDAQTISHDATIKLREALQKTKIELCPGEENLVDLIWTDRPKKNLQEVFHLPINYSGRESKDKVALLQKYLVDNKFWGFIVSALDEVGWLFNLRGSDIECNPNFFSYALITVNESRLYVEESNLTVDARNSLDNAILRPYSAIFKDLQAFRAEIEKSGEKLLISRTCNAALVDCVGAELVVSRPSPVELDKAIKNSVEIDGFRNCHLRDAAALIKYFAWLESELKNGAVLDEVDGADKLAEFRKMGSDFKGLSFETISGAGANGAIIHYKPEKPSAAQITMDQMYLCDSGGQYLDGTTDVTRTVHFGTPTDEEKECFTRVLIGHIALDRVVFPTGTTGFMLDCLARSSLWEAGLDYRHGTGHGVGHFLNVHEGPQNISFHIRSNEVQFKPGMTVTNEPGCYLDDRFGIRIENVLIVKDAKTKNNFSGVKFLNFENITMVPIATNLMDLKIMTDRDVEWVNEFHRKCLERVSPLLVDDALALEWLRRETRPIKK